MTDQPKLPRQRRSMLDSHPELSNLVEAIPPELERSGLAEAVAAAMLRHAVVEARLDLHNFANSTEVVLLIVPDAEWVPPVEAAWRREARAGTELLLPAEQYANPPNAWTLLSWQEPQDDPKEFAKVGRRLVWSLSEGRHVAAVSADLAWIHPDVRAVADHTLHLRPPDAAAIVAAAGQITGSVPTVALTDEQASVVTPRLLGLSHRRGEDANRLLRRLARLADQAIVAAGVGRSGMTLERMHGMDEAVAWGRALAADIASLRAGTILADALDRDLLLSGPPGCGKTAYAQALANS